MKRRSQHTIARLLITAAAMVCAPDDTYAQLRVVSYNTLDKPISSLDGTLFDTVFSAIAATSRNGFAKRVDVLALQEQSRQLVSGEIVDTSQLAADRLNSLFGVSSYQASLVGAGLDRVAIVYDTASVQLISAQGVDFSGTRPAQLATFLPVGYSGQAAELHLFSTHFNAGSSSTRASEALGLQQKVLELAGAGSHTIVAGDFNFGSSSEQGYQTLAASASSVTSDPLSLGAWPNSGVAQHMTQSTRTGSLADGGASGGMDDRFDLQLVTSPLLDGEGLSYLGPTAVGLESLEHSYQAFGNDGVSWNTRINNTLSGRSQSAEVLNALHNFSDHLPVVADYQVPAVLEAVAGSLPEELFVDEEFSLEVMIRNAADVVAAIGADELDYQLSVTGDLVGQAIGSLAALTAGDSVPVMLDTATPGVRSGVIIISTDSQGAANALVELPISFEVVASSLQGDFDLNGVVDAADYTVWRDGLGAEYDQQDYFDWRSNYGQTSSAIGAVGAPEPAAALVLWVAVASTAPFRRFERRGCSLA